MPPAHPPALELVGTSEQIRRSVATFNGSGHARDLVRSLLRTTSYWVFDAAAGAFGPAKFVGYSNANFATYEAARGAGSSSARFDGAVTRKQIEKVLRQRFAQNDDLAERLEVWADDLLGEAAFEGIDRSKWAFLSLAPTSKAEIQQVHDEHGRMLDARYSVEELDGQLTVVVESRGGTRGKADARNTEYSTGLMLLLKRLKQANAQVADAFVDSKRTASMSAEQKRLRGPRLRYPLTIDDPVELQRLLGGAQAKVRENPEAKGGGNPTKRIRLLLSFAAATPSRDDLHALLKGEDTSGEPHRQDDRNVVLGTIYQPADEARTSKERTPFEVDPDVVDRGNRGHATTQNALAEYLVSLGVQPLSPPPNGAAEFDLAWEYDDTSYVAEVKSITDYNEEKQLRLGLGQVLRYRQRLTKVGRKVVAVLVAEREPSDTTWVELCEELSVVIAWPGAFDRIPCAARQFSVEIPARDRHVSIESATIPSGPLSPGERDLVRFLAREAIKKWDGSKE